MSLEEHELMDKYLAKLEKIKKSENDIQQ